VDSLARYCDRDGRHPVMTLALVLAVPDGPSISRDSQYHRHLLDEPLYEPVRQAIERGRVAGVFALQLHGLEHSWPAGLMTSTDPAVRAWLVAGAPGMTEKLPSHLQSRWVDASMLPSRPLKQAAVAEAVSEEVQLFKSIFSESPRVVVPPTFVWTTDVEQAWAREGVEFVVTPGLRSACRDVTGLPNCDTGPFRNCERGTGVTYIVRNDYFEPERGHRAERGLEAMEHKWAQRRPCLFETHRSNFIGDDESAARNLAEIDRLYTLVLDRYPDLRFVSTEELGRVLRERNPAWVEKSLTTRLVAWLARSQALRGYWRAARLTGLAWIMNLVTQPLKVDSN
jgi:hypothetical protein